MRKEDIIRSLLLTYGNYGVTYKQLRPMIDSGIDEYELSPEAVYNGLRMALGDQFNVNEVFSVDDVMSITGETREEVVLRIEEMIHSAKATGGNPEEYAKEVNDNKVQRFIIPPGYLS